MEVRKVTTLTKGFPLPLSSRCKLLLSLSVGLVLGISMFILYEPVVSRVQFYGEISNLYILKKEIRNISRDLVIQSKGRFVPRFLNRKELLKPGEIEGLVKVICMVMTKPQTKLTHARHIRDTWGKRCQKTVFISSENDPDLPAVSFGDNFNFKSHRTQTLLKGIECMYHTHFHSGDFDWLLITEDDTYVIMENLRYFLLDKDTNLGVYYGCPLMYHVSSMLYSPVGAGVVLGRESLRRLMVTKLYDCFTKISQFADVNLASCLYDVGVFLGNSTDQEGKTRFHYYTPGQRLREDLETWYSKFNVNGGRVGLDSISDYSISFHGISENEFNELEYFVYHNRLASLTNGNSTSST